MFEAMWDTLTFGGPSLRWFARQLQGGIAGGTVSSPKALSRLASNLRPRWDLYFNVNPTEKRVGIRITSEDVTHWRTVLLDIDPTSPDSDPVEAARIYTNRAFDLLACWVPNLVVDSGRGVQVHLHLTPRALTGASDRAHVRLAVGRFLRAVAQDAAPLFGCKLDLSCSDLARVARMPQTINHKTGRETSTLASFELEEKTTQFACDTAPNVGERILALAGSLDTDFTRPAIAGVISYLRIWSRLTATAQRFLRDGAAAGERHRVCVAAVKSLQENGVPSEEAMRTVLNASRRCDPPLEPREALRILRAAYAA